MHSLRAKEIKDSPNSQAVPKSLVLFKKWHCLVPQLLRLILFLQYSLALVGHGGSSASSYLTDPTSPIPSHCASIVATSTVRVNAVSPVSYHDLLANPSDLATL